jgi:enoyl-CoA hydratase
MGTLQRLPRIVGVQAAAELAYTGRTFTGKEAEAMGLVLKCFDSEDDMMAHVNKVAADIASKSPLTIR